MPSEYRPDLRARVSVDESGKVRHVQHTEQKWQATEDDPRRAAIEYLRAQREVLGMAEETLTSPDHEVNYAEPSDGGDSFVVTEEKRQFDTVTVGFAQTYLDVPVWRAGITVTMQVDPNRVVETTNTTVPEIRADLPSSDALAPWRELCRWSDSGRSAESIPEDSTHRVREALGLTNERSAEARRLRVNRGRFYVYRYDPAERQPARAGDGDGFDIERDDVAITLPLPPVPDSIRPGGDYLVAEVLFTLPHGGLESLNWRALIEVETGTVLWLRALIAGVNGLVFRFDPITSTGTLTNTADQPAAVLDALRDDVALAGLDGAVAGVQSLGGPTVLVSDDDAPTVAPPTEPTGTDFDYVSRTDDFAAVSAYYHANDFFAVVEDLGFTLATYFDGTSFPVHVDHRASIGTADGIEVNAFCSGDADGDGIGLVGYCLAHTGDTTNPLGRAVDKYVHWHEIGGHGILWDHVDSPNFGFAHSAGDGLAGIQCDPESQLRELGLVERFRYTPFRPIRWMNRDVADGWGWGGANDGGGYSSEEILATTHFRIYRSIGGDSADLDRRRFASRTVTYLVLRAVGDLTPMTNPPTADDWWEALTATDAFDWTSEGLVGGAYHKVIRWAFEVQGLFRPPGDPTTSPGAPPDVDVFIDDGRSGIYEPYLDDFTASPGVWNRRFPDGGTAHEEPMAGFPNYVYVRVGNRGTQTADDPVVRLFQADPASGLEWPTDWTAAATPQLFADGPIASGSDTVVGPFAWTPTAAGSVALLASASATDDSSNADTVGGTIAAWRLVPFDNNLAQRDTAVQEADPCGYLGELADYITSLGLPHGLTQSLTVKLRNARRDCQRGHTRPACNKIGAWENEIDAQTGDKISQAQADVLRAHGDAIRAALGC